MIQPALQDQPEIVPSDCIFQTILGFMLPFFLAGAGGDPNLARAAVLELIDAYDAATLQELDLAGRIISFSVAAMDDLRRSMTDPTMSDVKVLRYRSNAVALNRTAERCRMALDALQAARQPVPLTRPSLATTQSATPQPQPAMPRSAAPQSVKAVPERAGRSLPVEPLQRDLTDAELEQMKLTAREMIRAAHARGGPLHAVDDPFSADPWPAESLAAAHAALAAAGSRPDQPAPTGTRC